MDEFESTLEYMVHNNVICNKGDESESFYIVDQEIDNSQESDDINETNFLEHFIDSEFYTLVMNRIKPKVQLLYKMQ